MVPQILRRRGLPLALATVELDDRTNLADLDDPRLLATRRLKLKGSPRALWRARGVFSA